MFSFENLEVYRKSLDLVGDVNGLCRDLKGKASYPLLDQLTRAALSVPLNIAEGNGRWGKNEKRHFFWMARGSAFEVVPILQILHRESYISEERYANLYSRLESISQMLIKLVRSVEDLHH